MGRPSFTHEDMIAAQQAVVASIRTKDAATFAKLYAEDGILYPPDGSVHRGRAEIEAAFAGMLAAGFVSQDVRDVVLRVDDETAVEEGMAVAEFTSDGATTTHRAWYIVIHRRQDDGSWLMHRDIWTAIPEAG
jgi:uncharacterized protein (TIGR02246 family)